MCYIKYDKRKSRIGRDIKNKGNPRENKNRI